LHALLFDEARIGERRSAESVSAESAALVRDLGLPLGPVSPARHLTIDSRDVVPGSVFISVPGEKTDGHLYIAKRSETAHCTFLVA
jgi:UDP-N-acetylmuramyl pentapeptide synthase